MCVSFSHLLDKVQNINFQYTLMFGTSELGRTSDKKYTKMHVILVHFQPCCLTCSCCFAVLVGGNACGLILAGTDVCICQLVLSSV